jgi:hypothetical protein
MTIYHYHKTGKDKKRLIEAVSSILQAPATYLGAPSFNYQVGGYTIDKDGTLSVPEETREDKTRNLLLSLKIQGFLPVEELTELEAEQTATTVTPVETSVAEVNAEPPAETNNTEENPMPNTSVTDFTPDTNLLDAMPAIRTVRSEHTLAIEIPKTTLSGQAFLNLQKIVGSKATLLKLALGTDTLDIQFTEGKIRFPWFTLRGIDGEVDAYAKLIDALIKMAIRQKRVTAKEQPIENAKFSMRLFLIRLGFIGDAYKTARKILTSSLTGNSSWKAGKPPVKPQIDPVSTESMETPSTLKSDNENKTESVNKIVAP